MKTILIDDEKLALKYLEYQLSNFPDIEVVGMYTDPFEGKKAIAVNDVDIVFLDIQIPEMNGMELAERLLEQKPGLYIVFVTAYDNFAIQAFEMNALDYMLKPVSKERLQNTLSRVRESQAEQTTMVNSLQDGRLRLNMFQQFALQSPKEQVIPLRWRTANARQLFLYLLQNRGGIVNKSHLIEMLWPDQEIKDAQQLLYTTVYHVRQRLAQYSDYITICNEAEGYRLQLDHVIVDVDQFEQLIRFKQLSENTIEQFEQAIRLSKGDYLQEYDYVWAVSERERLRVQWVRIVLDVVNWYYTRNEWEQAESLCLEACRRHPLEEEPYLFLMKIYAAQGNRSSVHLQYQQLCKILHNELHVEPSPKIIEWYHHWSTKEKQ